MRRIYPNPLLQRERDRSLVELFSHRGTISAIASELGVSRQAVSKWRRVPPKYVDIVSALLDVPPRKLYPRDP